jgi:hypothetical protein
VLVRSNEMLQMIPVSVIQHSRNGNTTSERSLVAEMERSDIRHVTY